MHILSSIYKWSQQQAMQDILAQWQKKGYCIVHFLYFANVVSQKLLEKRNHYATLLQSWDFILPDGIALQIFYRSLVTAGHQHTDKSRLANCNGTDLTMPLLQYIHKTIPWLVVHLYGATQSVVTRAQIYITDQWITTGIIQNGYSARDWAAIKDYTWPQVLLVGRWTPLQEQRVLDNQSYIQKHKMLVLTVGGLFDFWSWEEKRTPPLFRGRAEWLWRLCVNPRKNAHKVRYSLHLPYYILRYLLLKR